MNNKEHRSTETEDDTPYSKFLAETMAHYKKVAEGKSANDVPPHEPMLEAKTHIWPEAPDGIATNPEEEQLQEKRNAAYEELYKVKDMCNSALNAGKTLIDEPSSIWRSKDEVTPTSILKAISKELKEEGYNEEDIEKFTTDLKKKFVSDTDSNVGGAGASNAQLNELLETAVTAIRCCNEKKHEEAVALIRSGLARP
jgi:hypothetical protein